MRRNDRLEHGPRFVGPPELQHALRLVMRCDDEKIFWNAAVAEQALKDVQSLGQSRLCGVFMAQISHTTIVGLDSLHHA
ncbi:hypothetical protein D3C86_1142060 [compost metagenome]